MVHARHASDRWSGIYFENFADGQNAAYNRQSAALAKLQVAVAGRGERPLDFRDEIGRIERLDQDAIEARGARFGKLTFVRKPGRRDEGNVTQAGRAADLPRRLTPGHTGELEIQDDDVWTGRNRHANGFTAARGRQDAIALRAQVPLPHFEGIVVVVDEQDKRLSHNAHVWSQTSRIGRDRSEA
jgi:hypothetical protein